MSMGKSYEHHDQVYCLIYALLLRAATPVQVVKLDVPRGCGDPHPEAGDAVSALPQRERRRLEHGATTPASQAEPASVVKGDVSSMTLPRSRAGPR